MSAIHDAILLKVQSSLTKTMITDLAPIGGEAVDDTQAGVIKIGPLLGDPDPDAARISVELYENDPDGGWDDRVGMIEIGGCTTWRRRFTVLARCLLESTREDLAGAKRIGSVVRSRIEKTLLGINFGSVVADDGEIVTRGAVSDSIFGSMNQGGGPPDAYDIHIKIRFEILSQS
jgi:hypothetical protein